MVIDARVRSGKKIESRNKGGVFGRDERLHIGDRDETRLIDGMGSQVQAVYGVCADLLAGTLVGPALCFVDATVGWLERRPWMIRGIVVCRRATLSDLFVRSSPLGNGPMTEIAERIASKLPPA